MCVEAGVLALGDWLKPWLDPSGCIKVLSQAPHALGMALKRGRSQQLRKGKDQLYVNFEDNAGWWSVVASLSIVDRGSRTSDILNPGIASKVKICLHVLLLQLLIFCLCKLPIKQPMLLDARSPRFPRPLWLLQSS